MGASKSAGEQVVYNVVFIVSQEVRFCQDPVGAFGWF